MDKKCKICGTVFSSSGRKLYCSVKCRNRNNYLNHRDSVKEGVALYQEKNREAVLAKKKRQWEELRADPIRYQKYLEKRAETGRKNRLMAKYGITEEQYEALSKKQNELCAMCGLPQEKHGTITKLVVDHNHITGGVRGLLCDSCNLLLGFAKDDVRLLEKAIEYLNGSKN